MIKGGICSEPDRLYLYAKDTFGHGNVVTCSQQVVMAQSLTSELITDLSNSDHITSHHGRNLCLSQVNVSAIKFRDK